LAFANTAFKVFWVILFAIDLDGLTRDLIITGKANIAGSSFHLVEAEIAEEVRVKLPALGRR
jgi:hypothetical protein